MKKFYAIQIFMATFILWDVIEQAYNSKFWLKCLMFVIVSLYNVVAEMWGE